MGLPYIFIVGSLVEIVEAPNFEDSAVGVSTIDEHWITRTPCVYSKIFSPLSKMLYMGIVSPCFQPFSMNKAIPVG